MGLMELREIVDGVERELRETRKARDEYRRMCVRLMEIVDRQGLTFAEQEQLDVLEGRIRGDDSFAERLPVG